MNITHITLVAVHAMFIVLLILLAVASHLKNREGTAQMLAASATLAGVLFVVSLVSLFVLPTGHSTYRNIEAKSTRVGDILVVQADGIETITTGELRFVDKELFIRETQPRNAFGMRLEKRVSRHVKSESE